MSLQAISHFGFVLFTKTVRKLCVGVTVETTTEKSFEAEAMCDCRSFLSLNATSLWFYLRELGL